jgi:hypothetical protein
VKPLNIVVRAEIPRLAGPAKLASIALILGFAPPTIVKIGSVLPATSRGNTRIPFSSNVQRRAIPSLSFVFSM